MLQVAGGFAIAAGIVFSRRSQPLESRRDRSGLASLRRDRSLRLRRWPDGATPAKRLLVTFEDGSTAFAKVAVWSTAEWLAVEHVVYSQVEGSFLPRFLGYDDAEPRSAAARRSQRGALAPALAGGIDLRRPRSAGEDRCDLASARSAVGGHLSRGARRGLGARRAGPGPFLSC